MPEEKNTIVKNGIRCFFSKGWQAVWNELSLVFYLPVYLIVNETLEQHLKPQLCYCAFSVVLFLAMLQFACNSLFSCGERILADLQFY